MRLLVISEPIQGQIPAVRSHFRFSPLSRRKAVKASTSIFTRSKVAYLGSKGLVSYLPSRRHLAQTHMHFSDEVKYPITQGMTYRQSWQTTPWLDKHCNFDEVILRCWDTLMMLRSVVSHLIRTDAKAQGHSGQTFDRPVHCRMRLSIFAISSAVIPHSKLCLQRSMSGIERNVVQCAVSTCPIRLETWRSDS